jgi:hypothetical protein
MPLSRQLYGECLRVLEESSTSKRVVTRGPETAFSEPIVWESILLTVHFLCVVHAVQKEWPFEKLAQKWRARRSQRSRTTAPPAPLLTETSKALQALENDLRNEVIRPIESQIEAARKAVNQVFAEYSGTQQLPPEAASQIVSTVAKALKERGPDAGRSATN